MARLSICSGMQSWMMMTSTAWSMKTSQVGPTHTHIATYKNCTNMCFITRTVLPSTEEAEFSLPQEAFPLRHEIVDHPAAPEPPAEKPESPQVSGSEAESFCLTPMESFSLISVSQLLYQPQLTPSFFCPVVREMLDYYAEQGDVQMAVSVLIVLGDRIRKEIDELTQVRLTSL